MKVIKHRKYGASPEKPIFTQLLPVFVVDRQTDGRTDSLFVPKRNSRKVKICEGPVSHACSFIRGPSDGRGQRTRWWPHHFCCTRFLCLLCSLFRFSHRRRSHQRLGSYGTEERSRVSRPFISNQPLIISHTENSNGPSASPGDSHLGGGPVRNLPFMISFALPLIPPSALPYSAPLDLLFRSLHTCSASVFRPPGPRPL